MDKLNISTFPGCVEKTLEYIKTALKALHVSAADSEALLGSARRDNKRDMRADANGSVIVSAEKSAKGCCVQFMHLGALFNPCPKAPDSITQKCMDEISFEFKYGRNVLSVFRRANSDKNIQEVKEMKEIQIRNHSIKPGDKIAVINEHSKAAHSCARRGSCKRRQLRCRSSGGSTTTMTCSRSALLSCPRLSPRFASSG